MRALLTLRPSDSTSESGSDNPSSPAQRCRTDLPSPSSPTTIQHQLLLALVWHSLWYLCRCVCEERCAHRSVCSWWGVRGTPGEHYRRPQFARSSERSCLPVTVPWIYVTRASRLDSCCNSFRKPVLHKRRVGSQQAAQRWLALPLDHRLPDCGFPTAGYVHRRICSGSSHWLIERRLGLDAHGHGHLM